MRQRGLRDGDLKLLLGAATPVEDDTWLMTDADVAREIVQRKREIEQFQRLRGCKIIMAGDAVLTVYHSRRADQRRALRRGRESL
jgi:hypothetical protein